MPNQHTSDATLNCYRCGGSLASLSLPLSRRDLCPHCGVELHVCRMCSHYAPASPDGCDEEGAEAVRDRQAANFCDWFVPDGNAFDGRERRADEAARARAQALFDQDASSANQAAGPDNALTAAEDLFRK